MFKAMTTIRQRSLLATATIAVAALVGACTTPVPGTPTSSPRFCELWEQVEDNPTPDISPVVVDEGLIARAESATTLGEDCSKAGAQVLLDEATLAEGEVVDPNGEASQLRSLRSNTSLVEPVEEAEPAALMTGDQVSSGKPLADNLKLRSISAWIDANGISVTGSVDLTFEGVTSAIGFSGTFLNLDNWSIGLSSTAFSIPGITTTPATFSGALVVSGGQPRLGLSAAAAEIVVGDITVKNAMLDFSLDPNTGLTAEVSGGVEIGRNTFEGEVAVVLDSSGNVISAQAEVDATLAGWKAGGIRVDLDGSVTFDGNAERSILTFSGSGRIGELQVHNAAGSLEMENGVVTFDGEIDVTVAGARARMNGQIIFDGEQVTTPFLELEVSGEYSATLENGQVVEVAGDVTFETGLGGVIIATLTGDFSIGAIKASGSARIESNYNRTTLHVLEAELNTPGVNEGALSGFLVIEDGHAIDVDFDVSAESITFGTLALNNASMTIDGAYDSPLDISVESDLAVDGDMVTGHIEAAASFDDEGLLWLRANAEEVLVKIDGMEIQATAKVATDAETLTVELDGSLRNDDGLDISIGGNLSASLLTGDADWDFAGKADFDWGPIRMHGIDVAITPDNAETIDFKFFWDWSTPGRLGIWVRGKIYLEGTGIKRLDITTSFSWFLTGLAAEGLQQLLDIPVEPKSIIKPGLFRYP